MAALVQSDFPLQSSLPLARKMQSHHFVNGRSRARFRVQDPSVRGGSHAIAERGHTKQSPEMSTRHLTFSDMIKLKHLTNPLKPPSAGGT